MGDTLVDVVFVNEPHGAVLRVTIDRAANTGEGGGVTLSDCEAFHRALLPLVESIDYDTLEVESPGADRPIQSEADWTKAVGADIEINLYKAEQGAKHWHGRLISFTSDSVAIDAPGGQRVLPRRSIAIARPWISLDSLNEINLSDMESALDTESDLNIENYTRDTDGNRRD
jgi:ribosome maturation factor RimP